MSRQIEEELLLFNFRSYGRGTGRWDQTHLTPAQAQLVARTAARTPEVMVKVLSSGAGSSKAVQRHIDYIGRKGEVELLTDEGDVLTGKGSAGTIPDEWNLDLQEAGAKNTLGAGRRQTPPRLVHKLVFSMPAGTDPERVLSAAQMFCREEFALKHRYVMALHTDEPHPHVHVVLKAVSEQGRRLNIKKATLQEWRAKFAAHLREQGVAANATPRRFRDQPVRATPHALLRQRAREQLARPPGRERAFLSPGSPPLRVKDREPYTKT
ncbi:MAG: relaxase/mobilization nuclease domain-containing protein [Proteobacteria bacterium]|nr:relaxase/mobilization nuclease domain-containing protein [Pseudomonadota bacterium]